MRKTTCLWLLLAVICGCLLFRTSQEVTDGRVRLAGIEAETRKEDESIRVLDAEWSYLNQPDRLEKLSKQYLDLVPLKGRQFSKIADLGGKAPLPPAAAAAGAPAMATADEDDEDDDTSVDDAEAAAPADKTADKTAAETKTAEKAAAADDKAAAGAAKASVIDKYAGLKIDKESAAETVTPLAKAKAKTAHAAAPAAHTAAKAPLRNYVYSPAKPAPSPYAVYAASRGAAPPAATPATAHAPTTPSATTRSAATHSATTPSGTRDFSDVLKNIGGN